jgi:SAM-dependent methyltransferase
METNLHNIDTAIDFYDERYEEGYMEEWDESKKKKIVEIIRSLDLPQKGKALDFGCGNGVFTIIIKQCLPEWDVYGVEISPVAINNAKKKFQECLFFTKDKAHNYQNFFDFVFSHHVLEHVQSIKDTINELETYLKVKSGQLHILPCGNEDSFEYNICTLHKNGIESNKENRFFFEEPGHLRRLTSREFVEYLRAANFVVTREYFANQYYGAINWISKSSPRFVKKLTDTTGAVDEEAKKKLIQLKRKLLKLTYLQFAYSKYWLIKSKWSKSFSDYLKLSVLFLPALLSHTVYEKYNKLADEEWNKRKTDRNGSEMYLYFQRS